MVKVFNANGSHIITLNNLKVAKFYFDKLDFITTGILYGTINGVKFIVSYK